MIACNSPNFHRLSLCFFVQVIEKVKEIRRSLPIMVYKNPQFIFLDEATNALDANNERAITEGLASFYMRPLHGTGEDPGLFHLRIFLIFSIFMDKIVV